MIISRAVIWFQLLFDITLVSVWWLVVVVVVVVVAAVAVAVAVIAVVAAATAVAVAVGVNSQNVAQIQSHRLTLRSDL